MKRHSCIVHQREWEGNGARIEILYYPDPQPGEDWSDRIHLLITPAGEAPRGWLMNVEDAMTIIHGLSGAVDRAIHDMIPPYPIEVEHFSKNGRTDE